jgi:hypothetical protein
MTPALIPPPNVCALHKTHQPANLTVEWHHVIPVSWQLHTTLTGTPPFPGLDPDGRGMLWDCRGVWLCPTGHRNVHTWIVKLMHAVATAKSDNPLVASKAVKPSHAPAEFAIALDALNRYMDAAGDPGMSAPAMDLLALTAIGEWGEA